MSAARLCTTRLASLIALAALALFAGCTAPTPLYCDTMDAAAHQCFDGRTCNVNIHTCEFPDAAGDAGEAGATSNVDAPADKPTDGGTGEDHPASADGPRSDASDAGADVFHPCVNDMGCPDPTKPACQVDAGVCVGCVQNSDCKAAGARACDTAANKCVECVANGDCTTPAKPICDNQACRGCKVDSECAAIGPGVCMFHLDGRCATDSETVYVSSTGCADKADAGTALGTSHMPYCTSQLALDSTVPPPPPPPVDAGSNDGGGADTSPDSGGGVPASTKSLVVMRGPSLTEWSFAASGRTITVVGQSNAAIVPGARIGIHVSDGTVYIRSLRVSGGASTLPAVVADGGALHLDRSIVDGNAKGGILIQGAAYDITNSIIANNQGNTSTSNCGAWGGVCILGESTTNPGQFLNNTVIGNDYTGIVCDRAYPILGSIVAGGTGAVAGAPTAVCAFTACCASTNTGVDPTTFKLTAGSSCIDQLQPPNMSTAYDLDGTARPVNKLSDCGALEYVPTP